MQLFSMCMELGSVLDHRPFSFCPMHTAALAGVARLVVGKKFAFSIVDDAGCATMQGSI